MVVVGKEVCVRRRDVVEVVTEGGRIRDGGERVLRCLEARERPLEIVRRVGAVVIIFDFRSFVQVGQKVESLAERALATSIGDRREGPRRRRSLRDLPPPARQSRRRITLLRPPLGRLRSAHTSRFPALRVVLKLDVRLRPHRRSSLGRALLRPLLPLALDFLRTAVAAPDEVGPVQLGATGGAVPVRGKERRRQDGGGRSGRRGGRRRGGRRYRARKKVTR